MTDYLGSLSLGTSGTYVLTAWSVEAGAVTAEVIVNGTSASTLATNIEALAAALVPDATWAHYNPGASNPLLYRVITVTSFLLEDASTWFAFWQRIKVTFTASPSPLGAISTMWNAQHVDSPASLSLETLLGTRPTTLDVRVSDDMSAGMHSIWLALAPMALSDSKWKVLASALTWTTMSSGTGAAYWGNSNRYTTSSSYQTANLDTSKYPAGKYRLLARVAQSAGVGYVMESQNSEPVAVTQTTPHLLPISDIDLPVSDTARGTASNLTFSVKSDGTNTLYVNAFVLLPLDLGYASWHPTTPSLEITQLDVGPTGIFMDNVCNFTSFVGSILQPGITAASWPLINETQQPSGSTWPSSWARSSATYVTASTDRFRVNVSGADHSFWDISASRLITPKAWYELKFTRQVTSRSAGSAFVGINWTDFDGNQVAWDTLESITATDASPVTGITYYVQAPVQAARATVDFGSTGTATLNVYYSAVTFRPSPLRLIVVAEEAAGTLNGSYVHPVHVTVAYTPRYETAR